MVYPKSFGSPPNKSLMKKETPVIKNTILNHKQDVTLEELYMLLTKKGHTIIAADMDAAKDSSKRAASNIHFVSSSLLLVDIDEDKETNTYQQFPEIKEKWTAAGIFPNAVYMTASSTKEEPRFRLIFALDNPIEDKDLYQKAASKLAALFNGDSRATDPSRIFFPGQEGIYFDNEILNSLNDILKLPDPKVPIREGRTKSNKSYSNKVVAMTPEVKAIRELDASYFIENKSSLVDNSYKRWNNLLRGMLTKLNTISFNIIIKDYCTQNSRPPSDAVMPIDPRDYYATTSQIPLHEFLGVPFGEKFSCIYPDHEDNDPSARIELNQHGEYIMHCYSCPSSHSNGAIHDIFNVIETLAGVSHHKAKEFIKDVFGIHYETPWMQEKRQEITEYINYLEGDQFAKRHPKLRKTMVSKNLLGILSFLLRDAQRYLIDEKYSTADGNAVFFQSIRYISARMNELGLRGTATSTVLRKIKTLQKMGLIEVLPEEKIPQEYRQYLIKQRQKQESYYKHITFFAVPLFNMPLMTEAWKKYDEEFNQKGIKRCAYSYEVEVRTNGKESADQLYTQKKINDLPTEDTFYKKYKKNAQVLLLKNGYLTEHDLLTSVRGYKGTQKKYHHNRCLPQLIKELELNRKPFTKDIGEKLGAKPRKGLRYGTTRILIPK